MKKILVIAIVALVAMIGTASAYSADIVAQDGSFIASPVAQKVGVPVNYSIALDADFEDETVMSYSIESIDAGLSVNFHNTVPYPVTSANHIDYNAFDLTIDQNVPVGTELNLVIGVYKADGTLITTADINSVADASASKDFEAIPEFPTVALPVAAILGLAFLFQRRKEE
ncbi:PEF-CTERM sorting domain-containing protein [Methanolobus sp. ZRKC2]|uniref:PEF-CTERM sorting domain-containing protein n=1 Tax=Methanolobus sp. ZRKC2 TaxID=3125783 RepID=UPI00324B1E62